MRKDQELFDRIKRDDKSVIKEIYNANRDPFIQYFSKYGLSRDAIKDIYQDTMIAFYQNIIKGKLKDQKSTIKTYLFGIGKYKVIDEIRKRKKQIPPFVETSDQIEINEPEMTAVQKELYKHFETLSESCKQVLTLFYYRGLSIDEIVETGDFKNANTVKSSKSRCIKYLKNLLIH